MNSTLNCTRKPISHESRSDECDIGFRVQFNVEFPRQVMNFPIKSLYFVCSIRIMPFLFALFFYAGKQKSMKASLVVSSLVPIVLSLGVSWWCDNYC